VVPRTTGEEGASFIGAVSKISGADRDYVTATQSPERMNNERPSVCNEALARRHNVERPTLFLTLLLP
jgi:hypothetical protein